MLTVNGQPIADEVIETEFRRLTRAGPKNLPPKEMRELIPQMKQQAKDFAVNRQLLLEEAGRRAITVPDNEIDAILAHVAGQSPTTRATVANACKVEKLIATVISSVPKPTEAEIMKYLTDATAIATQSGQNPELMRKLIAKTGVLLQRVRQNQALNKFIAELREKAVIKDVQEPAKEK